MEKAGAWLIFGWTCWAVALFGNFVIHEPVFGLIMNLVAMSGFIWACVLMFRKG